MENGAQKRDAPDAWQTMHDSHGLQGFWQLHSSVWTDQNLAKDEIANLDGDSDGYYLKVSAQSDGTFIVLNSRNQDEHTYKR